MKTFLNYCFFVLWELAQGRWPASFHTWQARPAGYDHPFDGVDYEYEDLPDEEDDDEDVVWLCSCGHMERSEFHCSHCGEEPPWGCDCGACDRWEADDEVIFFGPAVGDYEYEEADDEDDGFPF